MGDGNIELRTKISFKVILFPVNPFLAVGTYGKERKKVGRPLMVLVLDYIQSDFVHHSPWLAYSTLRKSYEIRALSVQD
jgi:hypothetical protein